MKSALFAAVLGAAGFAAGAASADEGFWTFDNVPAAKVRAAYGVDITPAWLDHVRAAAVRLSIGCSGSVVSAEGLVLTNNHCVADCAHDLSPANADYFTDGYFASTRDREKTCAGLRAEILTAITDVTAPMQAAGAKLTGAALIKARDAEMASLANAGCGTDRKLHCEVVSLFRGGQFKLYRYRVYDDVRLVFSPGDRTASFGGDPDNFNFPRYALDAAFLRLYEDGHAVASPEHLRWNPTPPVAGQPVFVAGNPGQTFRGLTVAQLETQRDQAAPMLMSQLSELRGRLIRFGEESDADRKMSGDALMGIENDYKIFVGRLTALDDPAFMAARRAAEADLRAKALARMGSAFGDPWAEIAGVQGAAQSLFVEERMIEGGPWESLLFNDARTLVRAAAERERPSSDRLPEYADNQLALLERGVLDPTPVQPALEQLMLEFWLSKSREYLTADDPATKLLLGRESPEGLAARLVGGTRLGDPSVRKALWDGGWKAIQASDDPMIQFALKLDPEARRIRERAEDAVQGPTARAAEAIAKARFAVDGADAYPDGTFTLRFSYGAVDGWTYRGKTVPPFTTFAGLYDRATGQPPFDLDPRWLAARDKLDPATIFNISTTNDIIGGNSGSPLLDARGDVIGTAFDGNILSLGGDYGYDGRVNRAVAVTAVAISEALTKVYGADALVRELEAR
ncbi:MAG TPA: S46 family peptidase [Caulobacteraceae bacterium]|nr:S46 family peptidase [Caulobacteraceae bacterium]